MNRKIFYRPFWCSLAVIFNTISLRFLYYEQLESYDLIIFYSLGIAILLYLSKLFLLIRKKKPAFFRVIHICILIFQGILLGSIASVLIFLSDGIAIQVGGFISFVLFNSTAWIISLSWFSILGFIKQKQIEKIIILEKRIGFLFPDEIKSYVKMRSASEKYLAFNLIVLINLSLIIFGGSIAISFFFKNLNPLCLDILSVIPALYALRYYILLWRIEKGYFARNHREAKELIHFIESQRKKDKDDFGGGGKGQAFPHTRAEKMSNLSDRGLSGERS